MILIVFFVSAIHTDSSKPKVKTIYALPVDLLDFVSICITVYLVTIEQLLRSLWLSNPIGLLNHRNRSIERGVASNDPSSNLNEKSWYSPKIPHKVHKGEHNPLMRKLIDIQPKVEVGQQSVSLRHLIGIQ